MNPYSIFCMERVYCRIFLSPYYSSYLTFCSFSTVFFFISSTWSPLCGGSPNKTWHVLFRTNPSLIMLQPLPSPDMQVMFDN